MPVYRVNLNGRNFRLEFDGVVGLWGFYALRDVTAANPEEAVAAAVEIVRRDEALREHVLNAADDRPTLDVDEITEIDTPNPVQPGYIFYPEKPK